MSRRQSLHRKVTIKEGYLNKSPTGKLSLLKGWDRRWFVFGTMGVHPFLECYPNAEAVLKQAPLESIPLAGCQQIITKAITVNSKHPHSFNLILDDRMVTLAAETRNEMVAWYKMLQKKLEELGCLRTAEDHVYAEHKAMSRFRQVALQEAELASGRSDPATALPIATTTTRMSAVPIPVAASATSAMAVLRAAGAAKRKERALSPVDAAADDTGARGPLQHHSTMLLAENDFAPRRRTSELDTEARINMGRLLAEYERGKGGSRSDGSATTSNPVKEEWDKAEDDRSEYAGTLEVGDEWRSTGTSVAPLPRAAPRRPAQPATNGLESSPAQSLPLLLENSFKPIDVAPAALKIVARDVLLMPRPLPATAADSLAATATSDRSHDQCCSAGWSLPPSRTAGDRKPRQPVPLPREENDFCVRRRQVTSGSGNQRADPDGSSGVDVRSVRQVDGRTVSAYPPTRLDTAANSQNSSSRVPCSAELRPQRECLRVSSTVTRGDEPRATAPTLAATVLPRHLGSAMGIDYSNLPLQGGCCGREGDERGRPLLQRGASYPADVENEHEDLLRRGGAHRPVVENDYGEGSYSADRTFSVAAYSSYADGEHTSSPVAQVAAFRPVSGKPGIVEVGVTVESALSRRTIDSDSEQRIATRASSSSASEKRSSRRAKSSERDAALGMNAASAIAAELPVDTHSSKHYDVALAAPTLQQPKVSRPSVGGEAGDGHSTAASLYSKLLPAAIKACSLPEQTRALLTESPAPLLPKRGERNASLPSAPAVEAHSARRSSLLLQDTFPLPADDAEYKEWSATGIVLPTVPSKVLDVERAIATAPTMAQVVAPLAAQPSPEHCMSATVSAADSTEYMEWGAIDMEPPNDFARLTNQAPSLSVSVALPSQTHQAVIDTVGKNRDSPRTNKDVARKIAPSPALPPARQPRAAAPKSGGTLMLGGAVLKLPVAVLSDEHESGTPIRQSQIEDLLSEVENAGGVKISAFKKEIAGNVCFVDIDGKVWIAGWNQKSQPLLQKLLHVGDEVLSMNHEAVTSSSALNKSIRAGDNDRHLSFILRRLPRAALIAVRRGYDGEDLGLRCQRGTPEVDTVIPGGLTHSSGLRPHAPTLDSLRQCNWFVTEINNRPVNLFFKNGEVEPRLNALGKDVTLVFQPSDFVGKLKKQLKSHWNYKHYVVQ